MFYNRRRKMPINQYISRYMEILEHIIKEPLREAKKGSNYIIRWSILFGHLTRCRT